MNLFDDNYWCLNDEGRDLYWRTEDVLQGIMQRVHIGKMDVIQAEHIMAGAVKDMFNEYRLTHAAKQREKNEKST